MVLSTERINSQSSPNIFVLYIRNNEIGFWEFLLHVINHMRGSFDNRFEKGFIHVVFFGFKNDKIIQLVLPIQCMSYARLQVWSNLSITSHFSSESISMWVDSMTALAVGVWGVMRTWRIPQFIHMNLNSWPLNSGPLSLNTRLGRGYPANQDWTNRSVDSWMARFYWWYQDGCWTSRKWTCTTQYQRQKWLYRCNINEHSYTTSSTA